MLMWLVNLGNKVCDYFHISGQHRFITRLFVNMHWYGHFAVWFALLYAEAFPY